MAQIREELILYDKFTNTFTSYIKQAQKAAGATGAAQEATEDFARSQRAAANAASSLTSRIKSLVGAYAGLQGLKSVLNLSDTIASTTARIGMMNDGLQTTAELNQMIFDSAQRSRGAYADTAAFVAKLGNLAGDAFSSSAEIVAFAEQINKQIALSGATGQEAAAAMLQLTQGLSSGALRGEELNSVLEQTPMIAKTIADYMGVTTGEMRNLASEGAITAEVVKNAMFAAAEETNAAFESMPMTWGQTFTQIQNILIQTFQPALTAIGQLANFVSANLSTILPVVYGIAAAVGVLAAAYAVWKTVTLLQTVAQWALNSALLANPITWIVLLIAAVVGAFVAWANTIGGFQAAWLTVCDVLATAWDSFKILFFMGVYAVMNWLDQLSLKFQSVGVAVANWIGQMKVNVLTILQNMVNGAIDIINGMINTVNKLPFVSIQTIEKVTFAADAAVAEEAARQNREANLAAAEADANALATKRAQNITNMQNQAEIAHNNRLAEIDAARQPSNIGQAGGLDMSRYTNVPAYNEIAGIGADVGSISKDVGSIEKSVNMADEDIQDLVDMAERRYVNNINLTAQTPVITVNGANTGRTAADRMNLANTIRDILLEQASSSSVISTALPV